jgi:hypothetical protein
MSTQSEEQDATAVTVGDLALRAAVAYRVKARVAEICDPLIDANAAYVKETKGVRSTEAEMPLDGGGTMPVGAFTRSMTKSKIVVADEKVVLDYADARGETLYVVNPAFLKTLISRLRYVPKSGEIVDSTSGEVVPGFRYEPGGETVSVSPKWSSAGVEALDARLGFLDLALENLPGLTAGDFLTALEAGE